VERAKEFFAGMVGFSFDIVLLGARAREEILA
jgi:hypothetical protein